MNQGNVRQRVRPAAELPPTDTKEYADLRDRAAYVYATGTFPTHLRTLMVALLRKVARYSRAPASLDGRVGCMHVDPEMVARLGLDQHPMVVQVRRHVADGWRIQVARDVKARRPFGKVFLLKGNTRVTVQADGAIREGW